MREGLDVIGPRGKPLGSNPGYTLPRVDDDTPRIVGKPLKRNHEIAVDGPTSIRAAFGRPGVAGWPLKPGPGERADSPAGHTHPSHG